jgi:hypothetical protein
MSEGLVNQVQPDNKNNFIEGMAGAVVGAAVPMTIEFASRSSLHPLANTLYMATGLLIIYGVETVSISIRDKISLKDAHTRLFENQFIRWAHRAAFATIIFMSLGQLLTHFDYYGFTKKGAEELWNIVSDILPKVQNTPPLPETTPTPALPHRFPAGSTPA